MSDAQHRVDAELAEALAKIPKGPNGLFDFTDIPKVREAIQQMVDAGAAQAIADPGIKIETRTITSAAEPDVSIRLFWPADRPSPSPVLLWFHGGGQAAGFAAQEDPFLTALAKDAGCVVASVDYRLAPEARPPAAVNDGMRAFLWLHEQAHTLDLDRTRLAVAGTSGGGCIAAALALMIRDEGAPPPLFLCLTYPMLDDRVETASAHEITDVGVSDRASVIAAWDAVLGESRGGADVSPYAAPARATSLASLPPTFIAVGDLDVMRDENLAYANRLVASGVPTELHLFPGAYHAWDVLAPESQLALIFRQTWISYMRRAFERAT